MDPSLTLATLRELAKRIIDADDGHSKDVGAEEAAMFAAAFLDLDEWLTKGGFIPPAWATGLITNTSEGNRTELTHKDVPVRCNNGGGGYKKLDDQPIVDAIANTRKEPRAVYVLTERMTAEGQRTFWTKVGAAHENRDGSTTVKLEALPISGVLQIRDTDKERNR